MLIPCGVAILVDATISTHVPHGMITSLEVSKFCESQETHVLVAIPALQLNPSPGEKNCADTNGESNANRVAKPLIFRIERERNHATI